MIRVGALCLPAGAWLAPMAGVTDLPFRLLCREQGSAFAATEMVSAKGYLMAPENRRAVAALLARAPQEGPVALQLFGHEPDIMAEAARRLSRLSYAAIDLNMGCPAPKITGGGDGSALLRTPRLAADIVAAVRRATPLPLTVKLRLGWDEESRVAVPLARMLEAEGADALAVHGRVRAQFYAGEADWEGIARVKAAVSIPVIGNGDIASAADALLRMRETGCDGVMIGRAAMGNPWLFSQVRAALEGSPLPPPPTAGQRMEAALRHARMLCAWKGEPVAIREMRKHAAWYTKGLHGATRLRVRMQAAETLRELSETLRTLADGNP